MGAVKRAESARQLQRQVELLLELCGAQLEKIMHLQAENKRLKKRLVELETDGQ